MARLEGKTAIIIGAGQTPGDTIGNGRAMAILFAREGAEVLCVDRDLDRADETVAAIRAEGGNAWSHAADIICADDVAGIFDAALAHWRAIDILVNNVGIGVTGPEADGPPHLASEVAFDTTLNVNLKGMWLTIKAAIPIMRNRGGGAIVNISSLASVAGDTAIAYMVSKAAVNRLTLAVASSNAVHGIRCNAILPGLMDTPMGIDATVAATGASATQVRAARDARVPLKGRMGDAWDTAYAALFLASEEAKYVTGALLPVDGGFTTRVGNPDG
jgi:NAD(P)-dependent dehydrogenase (short-subunit alcohol dehydrogenase family)